MRPIQPLATSDEQWLDSRDIAGKSANRGQGTRATLDYERGGQQSKFQSLSKDWLAINEMEN